MALEPGTTGVRSDCFASCTSTTGFHLATYVSSKIIQTCKKLEFLGKKLRKKLLNFFSGKKWLIDENENSSKNFGQALFSEKLSCIFFKVEVYWCLICLLNATMSSSN